MQEMDRRVAQLRFFLADITDRERGVKDTSAQLRAQLSRLVDFTVQFNGGMANALSALAEVEERLAREEMTLHHLGMLRQRARRELDALLVTRGVADARARLMELESRRVLLLASQPEPAAVDRAAPAVDSAQRDLELAEIDAEIAKLHAAIEAASDAAARALTEGKGE